VISREEKEWELKTRTRCRPFKRGGGDHKTTPKLKGKSQSVTREKKKLEIEKKHKYCRKKSSVEVCVRNRAVGLRGGRKREATESCKLSECDKRTKEKRVKK